MTEHRLEPGDGLLHDCFSRDLAPVLSVEAGARVTYRLLDAGWHVEPKRHPGDPGPRWGGARPEDLRGHCLCGPVAVAGARPGTMLEVAVEEVVPGEWGWTRAGGDPARMGLLGLEEGPPHTLLWTIDARAGTARDAGGRQVRLAPFLGVMGNAPGEPGRHPTAPPRRTGGNLDCRLAGPGSVLYLPVEVEGALFSCGDGHARQGDGELSGTAIECPVERAVLRFGVRDDLPAETPLLRTPSAWVALGVGEGLDAAVGSAVRGLLALMERRHGLDRADALALASVAVDVAVTQVVNGVVGAHAVLADAAISGLPRHFD